MTHSKASQTKALAAENKAKAFDYRKAGISYRDIAKNLGVSSSTAHKYVTEELARISKETAEKADELRVMEAERLDKIFQQGYASLINGDLRGGDLCLKTMDRRAKLYGLDANTRVEITGQLLMSQEWQSIKALIIATLDKSPALKAQFLEQLEALECQN